MFQSGKCTYTVMGGCISSLAWQMYSTIGLLQNEIRFTVCGLQVANNLQS